MISFYNWISIYRYISKIGRWLRGVKAKKILSLTFFSRVGVWFRWWLRLLKLFCSKEIMVNKILGNLYKIGNIQRQFTTENYSSVQLITTKTIICSKNWKLNSVRTDTVKWISRTFQALLFQGLKSEISLIKQHHYYLSNSYLIN